METTKATDWREVRRRRAWDLKQQGWKQRDIAAALGVTEGAVSQWFQRARQAGVKALAARTPSGRPPQLSEAQRKKIPKLLAKGAAAHGFRGDLWTRRRVAVVIQREFGVTHCEQHIGTLLRACGWSPARYKYSAIVRQGRFLASAHRRRNGFRTPKWLVRSCQTTEWERINRVGSLGSATSADRVRLSS